MKAASLRTSVAWGARALVAALIAWGMLAWVPSGASIAAGTTFGLEHRASCTVDGSNYAYDAVLHSAQAHRGKPSPIASGHVVGGTSDAEVAAIGSLSLSSGFVVAANTAEAAAVQPRVLVNSSGVAYDVEAYAARLPNGLSVPEGWVPRVANNGNGIVWQEPGAAGNANMIRVADPTAMYPNGYIRVYNEGGQPISVTGKPGPQSDTHIPVGYSGPWVGWSSG